MVKEFLSQLGSQESEFDRLKRLEINVREHIGDFRASDRLTRDELHLNYAREAGHGQASGLTWGSSE
jgi:hypothetical protein